MHGIDAGSTRRSHVDVSSGSLTHFVKHERLFSRFERLCVGGVRIARPLPRRFARRDAGDVRSSRCGLAVQSATNVPRAPAHILLTEIGHIQKLPRPVRHRVQIIKLTYRPEDALSSQTHGRRFSRTCLLLYRRFVWLMYRSYVVSDGNGSMSFSWLRARRTKLIGVVLVALILVTSLTVYASADNQ